MQAWADGAISDGDKGKGQANHVRNPQEGKKLFVGSMQVTLKVTGAETGGRFTLAEVTVPPYFADIWPHRHQQTSEAIYLMQGMLAVTLGEETMVVRQSSFILVPPRQTHRFWNPAATPATFLSYFTPAGVEGFFEALSEIELDGKSYLPGALAEIWELGMRYDHFPGQSSIGDSPSPRSGLRPTT